LGNSSDFLAVSEVPFGYMIAVFFSLYIVEAKDFLSIERLGFITLIGSLVTSLIVAYKPVERHYVPFLVKRFFRSRNLLYSLKAIKEQPYNVGVSINFSGYVCSALKSKSIDKPIRKIRSIILLIMIVVIAVFIFLVFPPSILTKSLSSETMKTAGILLLLTSILLLIPLRQEIRELPLKLYLASLHLLGAQGIIEPGSNFNKLEEALNADDWPSAEAWAVRWYSEGKFYPRWPSEVDIPYEIYSDLFPMEKSEKPKNEQEKIDSYQV